MLQVGDTAPDFTVKTHEGNELSCRLYVVRRSFYGFIQKPILPAERLKVVGSATKLKPSNHKMLRFWESASIRLRKTPLLRKDSAFRMRSCVTRLGV